MKKTLLVAAVVFGSKYSYSQSIVSDKITALNKEIENAFNSNNMEKVAAFYSDSAVVMGGGMNVTGRSALDKYWMSFKDRGSSWKLEIDKIEDFGNIVIQRGRSYLTSTSGGQSNVRFLLIWKKSGDTYKVLYDTFTRL